MLILAAGFLGSPVACPGTQGSGTASQAFVGWSALRPSKRSSRLPSPAATRGAIDQVPKPVSQTLYWGRSQGGAGTGDSGAERRAAGEELGLLVSFAAMATVDLEKLRMSGAGKAIGVLTSGGDAQGDGARMRVYGWIWGFCLSSGPFGLVHCPLPRDLGIGGQPTSCEAPRLQVPVPRLRPGSLAYVLQATGLGMPRPRAA